MHSQRNVKATVLTVCALACAVFAEPQTAPQSQPAEATKPDTIFWEKQDWEPGGAAERLTLWADGHSEISLRVNAPPAKARPGWIVKSEGHFTFYRQADPLGADQATQKFAAALAAGICDLKTFPPGYSDGSGTLVGVARGKDVKQIVIPMFLHPDQPDNQGSANHKRFLAVEKILGDFSADAILPAPQK